MNPLKIILFLGLAWGSACSQINLTNGLGACYPLNGSGTEPVNNMAGTLVGVQATTDRFNNAGAAIYFPGTLGAVVNIPNSSFTKPAKFVSVSGWFKPASLAYSIPVFTKNTWTSYFTSYSLVLDDAGNGCRFKTYRQDGSGSDVLTSTTTVQMGTWYHVVFCISDAFMLLYVNGNLEASAPTQISSFNYDNSRGVVLGGTNESNFDSPYKGSIDNLRIYMRILNSAEVQALYQQDPECQDAGVPDGVSHIENAGISSYPNPCSNLLYLDLRDVGRVDIYAADGSMKLQADVKPGHSALDVSSLDTGIFLMKVTTDQGTFCRKIAKQQMN